MSRVRFMGAVIWTIVTRSMTGFYMTKRPLIHIQVLEMPANLLNGRIGFIYLI